MPTKNRHEQLLRTLKNYQFANDFDDCEIVVCDNSDQPVTDGQLFQIKNLINSFVYVYHSGQRNLIENFNEAIKHSKGKYIILVGDDDFVTPEIFNALVYMDEHKIECAIYDPDRYYWDNCAFHKTSELLGPSKLLLNRPGLLMIIDPKVELEKSAANGFLTIENMPRAYHGVVSRSVFDAIYEKFGAYIIGGSPDISIATTLSLLNVKTIKWPLALSIYGASHGSGGGMTTSRTHCLPICKATFLDKNFINQWDRRIPYYWSEYTVFPASAIYIYRSFNFVPKFNLSSIHSTIVVNEIFMTLEIFKSLKYLSFSELIFLMLRFPKVFLRKLGGRISRSSIISRHTWKSKQLIIRDNIQGEDVIENNYRH